MTQAIICTVLHLKICDQNFLLLEVSVFYFLFFFFFNFDASELFIELDNSTITLTASYTTAYVWITEFHKCESTNNFPFFKIICDFYFSLFSFRLSCTYISMKLCEAYILL